MAAHHVIIGGGPAATSALETIRQFDNRSSRITLISDEPAHSRMALPYWLAGDIRREDAYTAEGDYYQAFGVEARVGTRVEKIDPQARSVTLGDGEQLRFDDLLIATGASPATPPISGTDLPGVQPLWSLAHTDRVLQSVSGIERPRVVLIGAGFVGFIMLNAMFKRGWRLGVVESEAHVLPRMLDQDAAGIVADWIASQGVDARCGVAVKEIHRADDGGNLVELADGRKLPADLVILATGVRPNVELAAAAGIETDQGVLVNRRMQTNFPAIYAAGDVAQGPVLFQKANAVHAIQPTAVDHGRVAGANMAGRETRYAGSLRMNILDVCGLQCASFGAWDDPAAEAMTISSPAGSVYRKLLWSGDRMRGAIFVGRADDLGMLTDIGMVKGILQTQTPLGPWKDYLAASPFDIRRAYIGCGVARKLADATLLGQPSRPPRASSGGAQPPSEAGRNHAVYVEGGIPR